MSNYYVVFASQYETAEQYLFQALELAENSQSEDLIPLSHAMLATNYGNQRKV